MRTLKDQTEVLESCQVELTFSFTGLDDPFKVGHRPDRTSMKVTTTKAKEKSELSQREENPCCSAYSQVKDTRGMLSLLSSTQIPVLGINSP